MPALDAARRASTSLSHLSDDQLTALLAAAADALVAATPDILEANAADLARMDPADPRYDRLALSAERIEAIAADMRHVATLPSPRRVLAHTVRPNGLVIDRVAVPFGVIGVIYEARPNVTADVFALCFRSGNACVLKGGSDADASNRAIVAALHSALAAAGIDTAVLTLLPPTREAAAELLGARGRVDLVIPRGSRALIDMVRRTASVPVIETGAGVCHCYVDGTAPADLAARIVHNAKTRRVSVCNALDCLVIRRDALASLADICLPMADKEVVIHADGEAYAALAGRYPETLLRHAAPDDFGTEFLAYAMAVKTVGTLDEALAHIAANGSGHSEAIVTADAAAAERFRREVDAACVYVNAPTSWTDGAQFGLGAEIGISTQKLHARGPMALEALMTYKWLVTGAGQVR